MNGWHVIPLRADDWGLCGLALVALLFVIGEIRQKSHKWALVFLLLMSMCVLGITWRYITPRLSFKCSWQNESSVKIAGLSFIFVIS